MDFIDYVNGLEIQGGFQPVSFEMHCAIGKILEDEEPELDNLQSEDCVLLDSNQIPFIP